MSGSTSLTSTRGARATHSARIAQSDSRIGAPLPPDVTLPSWCRGSRENVNPHPVVNTKPAATYHPRASRPPRAFGEVEPLDPPTRARSARVAAPVAAGFKAGANPGSRTSTVDKTKPRRVSLAIPKKAGGVNSPSDGPQLLITSVSNSKLKSGSARHTVSGKPAEQSRRRLAVTRTCSTSASTAGANPIHPHATLFDALKDHTVLRAEWQRDLEAARCLTEKERERASAAESVIDDMKHELAMRRQEIEDAQAAIAAVATAEAKALQAEAETAMHKARTAELEAALEATMAGKEQAKQTLIDAETKVRDAHAAATSAAATAARDRGDVEAERLGAKRTQDALSASQKIIADNRREVDFARQQLTDMADDRTKHARALNLLRAERDTAKGRLVLAEAKTAEVTQELQYARNVGVTEQRKAAAALDVSRSEIEKVLTDLEASREETSAMKTSLETAETAMDDLIHEMANVKSVSDKYRFEAESKGRALTILRGQHEACVIATGGAPAPVTPLLVRKTSEDGEDGDDGEAYDHGDGELDKDEVGMAPPLRVSDSPIASDKNSDPASVPTADDEDKGGGRGGGDTDKSVI